ncbi:putative ceramide synthase 6 [Paratrimastix pyriformis]|uniref:Ceramide synthase 6 n=1 Tax=Paratrimastix pyriformis TaxID=342808 RepID=A0ABQ8UNU2_9EUKA|nr:putative ceramide synthase 6 [Paratrimastix pyriformis]
MASLSDKIFVIPPGLPLSDWGSFVETVAQHPLNWVPLFFVVITVIRHILEQLFFVPMAKRCVKSEGIKRIIFINKFKGDGAKTIYYILTTSLSWTQLFSIPSDRRWVFHVERVWEGFEEQTFPDFIYFMYSLQLGFYVHLLVYHFIEPKNKDFVEMLVHHIATIFLICYSWAQGCMNVGYLILALHDFADVFVGPTKMANFAGWPKSTVLGFVLLVSSWLATRLVYFPFWVVRSCMVDYYHLVVKRGLASLTQWALFNAFLSVLVVLHVYWFYCFVAIMVSAIRDNQVHDAVYSENTGIPAEALADEADLRAPGCAGALAGDEAVAMVEEVEAARKRRLG